jgi:hypothetical protein
MPHFTSSVGLFSVSVRSSSRFGNRTGSPGQDRREEPDREKNFATRTNEVIRRPRRCLVRSAGRESTGIAIGARASLGTTFYYGYGNWADTRTGNVLPSSIASNWASGILLLYTATNDSPWSSLRGRPGDIELIEASRITLRTMEK